MIMETLLGNYTIEEILLQLLAKDWRPGEYRPGVGIPEEHVLAAKDSLRCVTTAIASGKKSREVFAVVTEFETKKKDIEEKAKKEAEEKFKEKDK